MVYKTWSRHFSQNWHFYAMIGMLAAGILYLAKQVYTLKNEIAASKKNLKRRRTTRDEYSNKKGDIEKGEEELDEYSVSDDDEPEEHDGDIIDEAEPLNVVVEKRPTPELRHHETKTERPAESNNEHRDDERENLSQSETDAESEEDEQHETTNTATETVPAEETHDKPESAERMSPESAVPLCQAKIKSGKNKGQLCGRVATPENGFCGFHQP